MEVKSRIIYGLFLIIFSVSCASTTTISSTVPGADVYIGGKYKGTTPYVYTDRLPTGFSRKIEIRKDGYQPVKGKIRKLGRVNPMALYGVVCLGVPVLWTGGYKRFYEYELIPDDGGVPVKSDFLKFGPYFSTSSRVAPVYIGSKEGLHFVYAEGFLHTLNADLSFNYSNVLGKKNNSIPIDGYMNGDTKRVVEFYPYDNEIRILTIGTDNTSLVEFEIKDVLHIDNACSEDYCYGYKRSPLTNNFISYSESSVTLFDADLNKLDSYNCEKKIFESYLLGDDRIISLEFQNNSPFLSVRKAGEAVYYEIEMDKNVDNRFFRLNINEELGKCYISCLTGSIKNKDDFMPDAVTVLTYEMTNFTLVDSKNVKLTQAVKTTRSKYLVNKGVLSDKENVFVHLQEEWLTISTSSSGSSSDAYSTADLVIVNTEKEEATQQRIPKFIASSVHLDKLSYQVQLKGGQLYYVFNTTMAGKPVLNQVVLDTNLEMISWDLHNTYKDEGTIFHSLKSYALKDGGRLFFHQYKTKLGVAISEF